MVATRRWPWSRICLPERPARPSYRRRISRARSPSFLAAAGVVLAVLVAGGCTYATADPSTDPTATLPPLGSTAPPSPDTRVATTTAPPATTTTAAATTAPAPARRSRRVALRPAGPTVQVVEAGSAAALAVATSRALVASAPAVVVTANVPDTRARAAAASARLGVPLLVATGRNVAVVAREVDRLGARTVLRVGRLPMRLLRAFGPQVDVVGSRRRVPRVRPAIPAVTGVALVSHRDRTDAAARTTAGIAGLTTVPVDNGDPRATTATRRRLRHLAPERIVAIGTPGTFPAARVLGGLARTAARGIELPGGGQVVFPRRRVVAIYGHPGDDNLGVLGEQPVTAAVRRARRVAAPYRRLTTRRVVPGFELIATVASSEPGPDRDFSLESPLDRLRPWVDAAAAAGLLVVLDLQPGRTDFLTQARRYEELLRQPHVGLALDPEWRLARRQRHLRDIGGVSAEEVNHVGAWLAALTRRHALPQKLFIVHQFRLDMIKKRAWIRTHPELALLFQMDGQGRQRQKLATWRAITRGGPAGAHYGWKNFYDEDSPLRSPAATVALRPSPSFISYQ
jgi:hypothetical protein